MRERERETDRQRVRERADSALHNGWLVGGSKEKL